MPASHPRILFIVDHRNWAHDFKTNNLARILADEYEIRKLYQDEAGRFTTTNRKCRRPRALALFTGRSAAPYRPGQDDGELWGFVRAIGAKYLVLGPFDSPDIVTFVAQHRNDLEVIYTNADFKMYSISPSDQAIRVNQSNPYHPWSIPLRFH